VTRLIVGLGNPGPDYVGTRHNVGFDVVDQIAREVGVFFQSASRLDGYVGPKGFEWARVDKFDTLLVKPGTYMNRSGDVVLPLARFATAGEAQPADVLVVYDDLDLPFSRLRLRPHGGAGGHNGMRSIIDRLDSQEFPRLRVGIGSAGTDAARYVLARFTEREQTEMEVAVAEAAEAALAWAESGDIERCMTRFHSRWNQDG